MVLSLELAVEMPPDKEANQTVGHRSTLATLRRASGICYPTLERT
jgi:hypothetical protein